MRKISVLGLFFLSVAIMTSCKENHIINDTVKGWWTMDTIFYKGYNVKICLSGNSLRFEDSGVIIPIAEKTCEPLVINSFDNSGIWEIIDSENKRDTIPFRLKINTKNSLFKGVHKMVFHKDSMNKLLKMELFSDSLYIVCRKGLYNFDTNIKTIDALEKLTWTTRPKNKPF